MHPPSARGVKCTLPQGDKTPIQVDHSGLSPDSNSIEIMTVYRYLTHLEKKKKVTSYKMSYHDISRKINDQTDGFDIKENADMKFACVDDAKSANKPSSKYWFFKRVEEVEKSEWVQPCFRFKFERVQGISKVQKPYIITSVAMQLKPNVPVKVKLSMPWPHN